MPQWHIFFHQVHCWLTGSEVTAETGKERSSRSNSTGKNNTNSSTAVHVLCRFSEVSKHQEGLEACRRIAGGLEEWRWALQLNMHSVLQCFYGPAEEEKRSMYEVQKSLLTQQCFFKFGCNLCWIIRRARSRLEGWREVATIALSPSAGHLQTTTRKCSVIVSPTHLYSLLTNHHQTLNQWCDETLHRTRTHTTHTNRQGWEVLFVSLPHWETQKRKLRKRKVSNHTLKPAVGKMTRILQKCTDRHTL